MATRVTEQQRAIDRARIVQLRRDRWQNIAGQAGAAPALAALSWGAADHTRLIQFAVLHHVMVWVMAAGFIVPLRRRNLTRMPPLVYVGVIAAQATLSAALWFDSEAARGDVYPLSVGIVLYACAAGSLATLGNHHRLLRIAITCLLGPYCVATMIYGHYLIAIASAFFYVVVVVVAVTRVAEGQDELVELRLESAERAAAAERSAATDALTGLVNRLGFGRLDGTPVEDTASMFFIDLNRFKLINDTHGHAAGDVVLQVVARRLVEEVRPSDTVARLGGDEFVVLALGLTADEAEDMAGRLCVALQQPTSIGGVGLLALSASVGFAQAGPGPLDVSALLSLSDQAMYERKAEARQQSRTLDWPDSDTG